jgi:hypothetical protein
MSRPHSISKAYTTEKYSLRITVGSARLFADLVPGLRRG